MRACVPCDKSLTGEPILPSRTANQYLAVGTDVNRAPGTVRTVLAKPGVECSPECSPDLPRIQYSAWFAASERERTHKPQTRRSAPAKVQPSHPRGGLDL